MAYDVVVVGGGVIGLSTAYYLAKNGARVAVLERGEPGTLASNASAGMIAAQLEPEGGGTLYDFSIHSRSLYPALCAQLLAETGVDVELMRSGFIQLAVDEAAVAHQKAMIAWQTGSGQRAGWKTPEEIAELIPGIAPVLGAFWAPDDMHLFPARLVEAFAVGCARLGVEVVTHCEVACIGDDGTVVAANGEAYKAGRVIVAGGCLSPNLLGGVKLPVFPVKGQIMSVKLPRHLQGPWTAQCMPVFGPKVVLGSASIYFTPKRDGNMLVGATAEQTFDRSLTLRGLNAVMDAALRYMPILAEAQIVSTWTGLRPGTPDHLPVIGPVPGHERIFACTGHYRHGILLAPATGEAVAAMMAGRPTMVDLSSFSPERFL
jgi:glycine oxidase